MKNSNLQNTDNQASNNAENKQKQAIINDVLLQYISGGKSEKPICYAQQFCEAQQVRVDEP